MRKPLRALKNQLVNALLMVALTVPLIVVASELEKKPTLYIEGARIQVVQDGSIQLLFDVSIGEALTDGAQFDLMFNTDYITPSDFDTNAPLDENSDVTHAYQISSTLYQVPDGSGGYRFKDPFKDSEGSLRFASNAGNGTLSLNLFIDGTIDPVAEKGIGMEVVTAGEGYETYNVFDTIGRKLTICTLSFRVTDPDKMPEITRLFDGIDNALFAENHAHDDNNTKLLYFKDLATAYNRGEWSIGIRIPEGDDYRHIGATDHSQTGTVGRLYPSAQAAFSYSFPKTIIKARAAEAELTLNAYQVYLDGTVSDVDEALQRYSPAITVTYSDGSEGNFVMPWGRTTNTVDGLPWTDTVVYDRNAGTNPVVVDGTPAAGQVQYDPTASRYLTGAQKENQLYLVQKHFCYEEKDFTGVVQKKSFPVPVDVKLTVTPITLVDVTATDLHRSYILDDTLVDSTVGVQSVGALKLPTQARLVTDVPAGGVTLTMDIPGWSNVQTATDGTKQYWPYTVAGSTAGMNLLWKDGANETTGAFLHWPTVDDLGKWTDIENSGTADEAHLGANRAGNYTFKMADSYGGTPTDFTRPMIRAAYPWLTVPDNNEVPGDPEAWPIEDATRTIVWNGAPKDPDDPDNPPKLMDTNNYRVSYVSTLDAPNKQPELTLQVRKVEGEHEDQIMVLPKDSLFRIKLPDGTEMAVGYQDDEINQGPSWFDGTDGNYHTDETMLGTANDRRAFNLISNPGDPTQNSYGNEREKLRRYINLGGWFSVAVKEIEKAGDGTVTTETLWSDFIPVYVPPRDNYYTESKEYNFIGDNAGLYPWPGGVSTTVILPPGTYNPVEINAAKTDIVPVYESDGVTRKVERYGLSTTYDGTTGAQPGELNTFTVDPAWTMSGPVAVGQHSVTTYGKNHFLDSAVYSAYGKVLNWVEDRNMNPKTYTAAAETGTIRVETTAAPEQLEKIILEYVETHGGEQSVDYDGAGAGYNVSNVIFETKTQGYTMRQDYVLRIRNVGDVDISGLSIDTLTDLVGNDIYDKDLDANPAGGHFELLKPPASFLPAGESTTFVLTYVYNLNAKQSEPMNYRDKLFITSNSKHTVGNGAVKGVDYLLDFDAQFQVTNSDIHRVFVNVIPEWATDSEGNQVYMPMGTANVIIGMTNVNDPTSMNTSAGPTAYPKDVPVFILVSPVDEYTMVSVVARDSTGTSIPIGPFDQPGPGKLPDGRLVYAFVMPDYDTTVTVVFNEPVTSKLRLSDLRVYADQEHRPNETPENLYPHNTDWDDENSATYKANYQQRIWQKSYTDAEKATANTYTQGDDKNLYLMTKGTAFKPDFDSQVDQYLVVLPSDADWAQVEVDLRKVEYIINDALHNHYNNALTGILVQMTLYDTDNVALMATQNEDIYPQFYQSNSYAGYHLGQTNPPTTHTSIPFLSPDPGDSKYVRVQMSYTDGTLTETRAYYIELHRAPREVDATLNYGNSPYGMIMNDPVINAAAKDVAKERFVDNNYTFNGVADPLIPSVVKGTGLLDIHYWLEAWAAPTEKWMSPNADWTNQYDSSLVSVYDDDTGMSKTLYDEVHKSNVNLDLNDYAFFAIMGERFLDPGIARATDSSGRPADLSKATLYLTAYTLDSTVDKTTPDDQEARFTVPTDPDALKTRTVTFDFLDDTDGTVAVSGDMVRADWAKWYLTPTGELTRAAADENTLVELRPGRYELVYSFPDYNHIPADPANGIVGEKHYLTVKRDFVVLAPVGDVNADLVVTTGTDSDEALMEGRISPDAGHPALGYMAYANDAIFKLRVCDVNNDRNINNIDANTIQKGTTVQRFYLPIHYKPTAAVTP